MAPSSSDAKAGTIIYTGKMIKTNIEEPQKSAQKKPPRAAPKVTEETLLQDIISDIWMKYAKATFEEVNKMKAATVLIDLKMVIDTMIKSLAIKDTGERDVKIAELER